MSGGAPRGPGTEPRAALLTDSFMHKHICVPGSRLVTSFLGSSSHLFWNGKSVLLTAPVLGSHAPMCKAQHHPGV